MSNNTDGINVFVGKRRKDGKFPVTFVFPLSGARSSKIMTEEALDEFLAKTDINQLQGYTLKQQKENMKLITQKENVDWTIVEKGANNFVVQVYIDGSLEHQVANIASLDEAREFLLSFLKKLVFDI